MKGTGVVVVGFPEPEGRLLEMRENYEAGTGFKRELRGENPIGN